MIDYPPQNHEQVRDYLAVVFRELERERGEDEARILAGVQALSRDRCRTPLQWADAPNGGFSPAGVETWLPVNPNYAAGVNVAAQDTAPDSLLNFYRQIIAVRQASPALTQGDFQLLGDDDAPVIAFMRTAGEQTVIVALNYSAEDQDISTGQRGDLRPLWPTGDGAFPAFMFRLAPYTFVIAELS